MGCVSLIVLKKLERNHDPTNRSEAFKILEEGNRECCLVTGLIYITQDVPTLLDQYDLPDEPLNRLPESRIRPARETIDKVNAMMF